jgi:hypothetical protein
MKHAEFLDRLVARGFSEAEEPPHVRNLRLPYPDEWSPGRVRARWPMRAS